MFFILKCRRYLLFWRIIILFSISYFIYLVYQIEAGYTKFTTKRTHNYLQSKIYVNIDNLEFYIYSATVSIPHSTSQILDVRLAVLDGENINDFYCCFTSQSEEIYTTQSKLVSTFNYNRYHYTAKQYSCSVPTHFKTIEVYFGLTNCDDDISKGQPIYFPPVRRNETAFCTKTAFGNISTNVVVEYLELHRALGVSKILVHDLNLNKRIKNILHWYQESGLVYVLPMEFPGNVSEEKQTVRNKLPLYADAQIAVYDCIERLSGYGFIGIVDFDEILVPSKTSSIPKLLKDLSSTHENAGSFEFGVEHFVTDWNMSHNSTLGSMKYIQRMEPDHVRPKMVHIPGRVGMVWTHDASPLWGFKRIKMNGDLDEDVIFENSLLYKHLQKAGMEDITAETINHIKPNLHSKPVFKQVDYASLFIDILGKFYQSIVFYCSKTKWGTENLEAWYHMTTLKHVQNSKALEEEDSAFLENYINCNKGEAILTEPSVYDCFTKWNGPINYLSTGFLLYTLIWCTGIFPMNLRPMADFLAVGFGVCIMITCFDVCFYWWKRRIFMDTAAAIEKCIKTSEKVLHLTRQSLRLIQETELVARGFTLVSQRVAVSGLEQQSSSKLCSELRKTTFYTARSGMLTFREATLKLLELHPLIPEVDSVCNYLASVPLSDYGPCLQLIGQQADNSQHLSQLTDGFSVAALRGMNQLFALYLSEFIRRLTLCFIYDAQIQGSPAPFDKLGSLMEELYVKLEKEQTKLQKSYDFHRSSPLNREPSKFKFEKSKSKTGGFHTAVHSLELHLHAALVRTQELSLKLEKEIEEEINQTHNIPDLPDIDIKENDSWLHIMKEVKGEIEACKGCWEDGIGRLEKSKDKTVPKLESFFCEIKEKKDKEVNIVDIGEYIIEDQVFEGYTDPDENEDEATWNWEPILSAEEKEKRKREREEAKRLLSELRSVISVRAEDRERREKVAMAKSKGQNSHPIENAFDITIKKQRLNDEFENGTKIVEEIAEIKMYVTEKSVDPDLTLSNSDVFSSTKADISATCSEQVSGLEISPIVSEEECSQVTDNEPSTLPNETSKPQIPKDVNCQNTENINNSACYDKASIFEDTFASISALDEMKLSTVQTDTDISLENQSDSEFSTTSSKDVSYSQSSIDVDSSSCNEDSLLKSANTSKSSSGFFDGKDMLTKPENPQIANQKNNNTYSISQNSFSQSETNALSSLNCDNPDSDHPIDADAKPKPDAVPKELQTLNNQTNCDNGNPDVSSSYFTPAPSFAGNISGVASLVDSQLDSSSLILKENNLPELLPNDINDPELTEATSKCESFQSNLSSPSSNIPNEQTTSETQNDYSIIDTHSQNFLEQSTGFENDANEAMSATQPDENTTFETGIPSKESTKSQDVQEMTFEHDPDLEGEDSAVIDSSDQSLDVLTPDTSSSSTGETGPTDLDIRISRLPGANLAFSANIAAAAAARSVTLNLNIDTFGDSASDEECECSCDGDCQEEEK